MFGFRLSAQEPPDPRRITDAVVMRFDQIYEVDPDKMSIFEQQDLPAWDTHRIVDSRGDHLAWMHRHFADKVLGMSDLGLTENGTEPED